MKSLEQFLAYRKCPINASTCYYYQGGSPTSVNVHLFHVAAPCLPDILLPEVSLYSTAEKLLILFQIQEADHLDGPMGKQCVICGEGEL